MINDMVILSKTYRKPQVISKRRVTSQPGIIKVVFPTVSGLSNNFHLKRKFLYVIFSASAIVGIKWTVQGYFYKVFMHRFVLRTKSLQ